MFWVTFEETLCWEPSSQSKWSTSSKEWALLRLQTISPKKNCRHTVMSGIKEKNPAKEYSLYKISFAISFCTPKACWLVPKGLATTCPKSVWGRTASKMHLTSLLYSEWFIKQFFFPRIMYISSSTVNDILKSNIHLTKCRGVQNRNLHLSHVVSIYKREELALLRCSPLYSKVNV